MCIFVFFKQKTAYEMRISDWSSDVCSSDLASEHIQHAVHGDHHDHPADEHSGDDVHLAHAADAHEGTAGYRPHESPISMLIPLGVLSLGAVLAGFLFNHPFIYPEEGAAFWKGSIDRKSTRLNSSH